MRKLVLPALIMILLVGQIAAQSKWSLVYGPGFRTVNSVVMHDNNSIVTVGGSESNDKIRTIGKSSNGGLVWNYVRDQVDSSWLKAMCFPTPLIGYATGYEGVVLKTTDGGSTWSGLTLTGNFANRNYNAIFFTDALTGYIAGGNQSNDSIQTILKTTDGGVNWSPQRDVLGYWLKDIYFLNANTGFAVGENGVVLKTTNGGGAWNPVTLTGNAASRTYNAIYFADANTGVMVGGNRENDSIQTILRSTDGGNNWGIISDNIGSWLSDVQFYNADSGIAVGDDGTVLTTFNKGLNWNSAGIADSVNDKLHLYTVHFYNAFYGIVAGQLGKTLLYRPAGSSSPQLTANGATFSGASTVTLHGVVHNIGGLTGQVSFDYGTDLLLTGNVVAAPPTVSDTGLTSVSGQLASLSANTHYYFRVKVANPMGIFYSGIDSFYSSGAGITGEIPNWDFELWDSLDQELLVQWGYVSIASKVPSFDGGNAVEISAAKAGDGYKAGVILFGTPGGDDSFKDGAPFSARPDSIIAFLKYDVLPTDSALILVMLKSAGQVVANNFIYITGSSGGNFVRRSFPLSYQSIATPDTLILGFANFFPEKAHSTMGNPFTVDKVSFSGTSQNIPNNDFENWVTEKKYMPQSWAGNSDMLTTQGLPSLLERVTDRFSGSYAIKINSGFGGNKLSSIADFGNSQPAFALHHKPFSFTGRHKILTGPDTLYLEIQVFANGVPIGFGNYIATGITNTFKPFNVTINYNQNLAPDSACIRFSLGNSKSTTNSSAIIDALAFDGFVDSTFNDLALLSAALPAVNVFPNPSSGHFNISITNPHQTNFTVEIVNINGNLVQKLSYNGGGENLDVDLINQPAGAYFVLLRGKEWILTRKILKVK